MCGQAADASRQPRGTESADCDTSELEHEPVLPDGGEALRQIRRQGRRRRGPRACRWPPRFRSRRSPRTRRSADPVADHDVCGEQDEPETDSSQVRDRYSAPPLSRSLFHRSVNVDRPILKRAVIEQGTMSEQPRCEDHRGRLLTHVAVDDHRVALFDPRCGTARRPGRGRSVDCCR